MTRLTMMAIAFATSAAMVTPQSSMAQQTPPATEIPLPPKPGDPGRGRAPDAHAFVADSLRHLLFCRSLSEMAVRRAKDPGTRKLAERFLGEYQKAKADLVDGALRQNVHATVRLNAAQTRKMNALKQAPRGQWDAVYLSAIMDAEQADMRRLSLYASKGRSGAIKHYAQAHYPLARMHFLSARHLAGR